MRRNPPARRLGVFAAAATLAMASSSAPDSFPMVDFQRMGTVNLGGAFSGLDWFSEQSPFAAASSSSQGTTFSSTGDTLVTRNDNGTYTVVASTNAGGTIKALCYSSKDDTLYAAGNFSSLASTSTSNIVAYSPSSKEFRTLQSGLPGTVDTLYCDDEHHEVWAGGTFAAPEGGGSGANVARWDTQAKQWTEVPFGGLNGPVDIIAPNQDGSSLYFGGEFTTQFADSTNATYQLLKSIPSAPNNTITTGKSGYLTPFTIPERASQWSGLDINAGPATSDSKYNDVKALVCPELGTWMARDGSPAKIEILSHAYLTGAGIRISNGRVGKSTSKAFTVISLPDNHKLSLTYTDPQTGQTATCTDDCPLSTDPNVGAQDFLFADGSLSITGFDLHITSWDGDAAALNYVELLSDGAYSSAVEAENHSLCGRSNNRVNAVGNWQPGESPSEIAGTVGGYLKADVPKSSTPDTALTLYPWVGSSAFYDIYLVIPGCNNLGDCATRTSVDVSVFPAQDSGAYLSNVQERVEDYTRVKIYSGWVEASTDAFSPTVNLKLAENPSGVDGDNYVLVASGVELVLTGVESNGQMPFPGTTTTRGQVTTANGQGISTPAAQYTGTAYTTRTDGVVMSGTVTMTAPPSLVTTNTTRVNQTRTSIRSAYGVFEWPRSSNVKTDTLMPNTTETQLTQIGFALAMAKNASADGNQFKISTINELKDHLFVGGRFTSRTGSISNVLLVDKGQSSPDALANSGLNGLVNTAAVVDNAIYFGGEFTGASQGGSDLKYIAKYDPDAKSWSPVGGGVDGPVRAIRAISGGLLVAGDFNFVLSNDSASASTGGFAVWNFTTNDWNDSGIIYGNGAACFDGKDANYVAGRFTGYSRNAAQGIAAIKSEKNKPATIESVKGASFTPGSGSGKASNATGSNSRRSFFSHFRHRLAPRADAPAINTAPAIAPATLTGAYWKNASSKADVVVLGGNFTAQSGSIKGVAFQEGDKLTGPSPPVDGVVRALEVHSDTLYVGGDGLRVDGLSNSGVHVYDLKGNEWRKNYIPPLATKSGDPTVNYIRNRPDTEDIIVAGDFATAGSLSCAGICMWQNNRWQALGSGLQNGEVKSFGFAGEKASSLFAGGSFTIQDASYYAAVFNFVNQSWTPIGKLPGPVLSIAVDDNNSTNVFASGYGESDNKPYLQRWDGKSWSEQNSSALLPGTTINNLAFVPLMDGHTHDVDGPIENNRLLMATGQVHLAQTGNVSSALYDGAKWIPYMVGSTAAGTLGAASGLFYSDRNFNFKLQHYLARGIVVLVAMAIATALILLLILLILLAAYCMRRYERRHRPQEIYEKAPSEVSSTHQIMLNSVQTALEQSLLTPGGVARAGAAGGVAGLAAANAAGKRRSERLSDHSHYTDDERPPENDEFLAAHSDGDSDDGGRETVMRYDFGGPDLETGELSMRAGQRVIILDDEQSDEWWYARDPATGREGVVPATYVL